MATFGTILNPLQQPSTPKASKRDEDCNDVVSSSDEKENLPEPSTPRAERTAEVLHWSIDRVQEWLRKSVSFNHDRTQEFLHIFQNEGIDGLGLLTLQRNHRACMGMTDFEWLLLKGARKRLVVGNQNVECDNSDIVKQKSPYGTSCWTPPTTPKKGAISPPGSPQPFRSSNGKINKQAGESPLLSSPMRMLSLQKLRWTKSTSRDEQIDLLVTEVQSLRGEIVSAEEREVSLRAQIDNLDEVLRTSQLASYLHTRTRWTLLPGEPLIDDTDVDDWLQRFLVLQGSSIFFYTSATDFRPQGTILLSEVVEAGPMSSSCRQQEGDGKAWYGFYLTTCHGLRLECSTPSKLQMDHWLKSVGGVSSFC